MERFLTARPKMRTLQSKARWLAGCAFGSLLAASTVGAAELVSVNSAGTDTGNSASNVAAISADGRFVALQSLATDLDAVTPDTNGTFDIYLRDLQTGTTTLVSVNSAGADSGNGSSSFPVISADGRFVAFRSRANDLDAETPDTNGTFDIYLRDLQAGTTRLVSVNSAGIDSGNSISQFPVISADGLFVAFVSFASDLVTSDTNGTRDIYVRDLQAGTTRLVSVNDAGTDSGNSFSDIPVISADGLFVGFRSLASDLVITDTNGNTDIYVRDLQAGTTTLVSVNSAGTDSGNFFSRQGVISADGGFVAFVSGASDLVITDTNGNTDIYVRDLQAGTTTLVSVNSAGTDSGNSGSDHPVISADGRFVAFRSLASNLDAVTPDTNVNTDIYLRDLQAGTTTLVSVNSVGTDGGNGSSQFPVISADGRFVGFDGAASDLDAVTPDTNGTQDVYLRDLQAGTTTLMSVNSAGTDSGNSASQFKVISADGRFVEFVSFATDLDAMTPDTNGQADVFVAADTDGDGVFEPADNCPTIFNPDQTDSNGDGFGDACVDPSVDIPDGADVDPTATVGAGSTVNKDVVVGPEVDIGENTDLNKGAEIGEGSSVGGATTVNQNVTVGQDCEIGDNVTIGQNVMIGDGVVIGDNTVIGQGTVIQAGVMIGTNVSIGKDSLITMDVADGTVLPKNSVF